MIARLLATRRKLLDRLAVARSFSAHRPSGPPLRVQIEITNRCNLRCGMCDRWRWGAEERSTSSEVLDDGSLDRLVAELAGMGVREILMTGGEPTLRPGFDALLRRIRALGMTPAIITNGTAVTPARAQAIVESGCNVTVSVDGRAETHDRIRGVAGAHALTIEGIRRIAAARAAGCGRGRLGVNFTVQRANAAEMPATLESLSAAGVDEVAFNLVHGNPGAAPGPDDVSAVREGVRRCRQPGRDGARAVFGDLVTAFADGVLRPEDVASGLPARALFLREPVPCFAAYRTSFVDGFGRVFPCCFCYLDNLSYAEFESKRERFVLGNVREHPFREIWSGARGRYAAFRARTDPVDGEAVSTCCGQCYDYFLFRRASRLVGIARRTGLLAGGALPGSGEA